MSDLPIRGTTLFYPHFALIHQPVSLMLELQTIYYFVAALSVMVAAVYYVFNLRGNTRTRQAQLFMQLYDRFHDTQFWKQYGEIIFLSEWTSWDDFWGKYGPTNIDAFADWMSFGTYFSGIGVLLKEKMIDVRIVDNLVGDYVFWVWEKLRTLSDEMGAKGQKPQSILWIEYLYNEINKEREREKKGHTIKNRAVQKRLETDVERPLKI